MTSDAIDDSAHHAANHGRMKLVDGEHRHPRAIAGAAIRRLLMPRKRAGRAEVPSPAA